MPISGTDLALTTARVGRMRVGAFRVGFIPEFVTGPGTTEPGEYGWDEVKPPSTQWTLLTEGIVCGKRPIAGFTMTGETLAPPPFSVTWTVVETEEGAHGESFTYDFTPIVVGGVAPFTYEWDFGDGEPPDTNETPTQVWPRNGWANPDSIPVELTVTDDNLDTAVFADDVTVWFNE